MQRLSHNPPLRCWTTQAGLVLALTPALAIAEVSDKVPTTTHIWVIALAASGVCGVITTWRPWLGTTIAVVPALWLTGLLMDVHSPDIAVHLSTEQGWSYYLQAYLSVGIFVLGLVMGLYLRQRRRKIPASTGNCK